MPVQQSLNQYSDTLCIINGEQSGWWLTDAVTLEDRTHDPTEELFCDPPSQQQATAAVRRGTAPETDIRTPLTDPDTNGDVGLTSVDTEYNHRHNVEVEYPRERDHGTVDKYRLNVSYHRSTFRNEIKEFDINIDREQYPDEAERIEQIVTALRDLPVLKRILAHLSTYDELVNHAWVARRYDTLYEALMKIWTHDSLASYAVSSAVPNPQATDATPFEVNFFTQGFYLLPFTHNNTVQKLVGDKLEEAGIGNPSIAWGGYILDDELDDVETVHKLARPFYKTPNK